jgi:erythromycin esterase-like protein
LFCKNAKGQNSGILNLKLNETSNYMDFEKLDSAILGKKYILLGESSHTTNEYASAKVKIKHCLKIKTQKEPAKVILLF